VLLFGRQSQRTRRDNIASAIAAAATTAMP